MRRRPGRRPATAPRSVRGKRRFSMRLRRRFHDLRQHSAHVLGVHEEDERAVRSDAWIAEDSRSLRFELGLGGVNVRHFKAHVLLSSERVLFEELHDGRILAEGLDQFDLRVRSIDETHADALRRQVELRTVGGGLGLLLVFAVLVLKTPVRAGFAWANAAVGRMISST